MTIASSNDGIETAWKWVPEGVVQTFPFLRNLRAKSAAKHAEVAAGSGNPDEALAEYAKAVELEPEKDLYLYELGRIYYERDDLLKAEDCFRRTLNVNFSYALAIKGLGYAVHRLGKINEAIYCYLRYLDVQPDDVDVHANLIAALESQGRYDEAIAAGQRAVQRFPSNATLLFMLARNNFFAGKVDAATVQLKTARDLDPENSEIYRVLGVALKTQGDFDGALINFQEALKHNPSDADAHLAAADVYQRLGRHEEYLRAAQEARRLFESLKNDSSLKYACWEEGWALFKLGRWEESVNASECALKIDDSLTAVRFNLALALLHLGNLDRAKEEYRKAREPGDAEALKNDGIDDLKLALQERPNLPGGKEILQALESVYQDLTSKREERLIARTASAGGPRTIS